MKEKEIFKVIEVWLEESFDGGRHLRRIEKLDKF
jgi:ribose 5-phosphate isomerase RpiB